MERLSADLTARFGRGFGVNNLESMRRFFLAYPPPEISQTLSGKLGNESPTEKSQTVSRKFDLSELAQVFTLPWSAYVRLLSVKDDHARQFYETEALRGGWSVRQLDRQIGSQFYERTALSKDKAAMLVKGSVAKPNDAIKDPYVLEFLDLNLWTTHPLSSGLPLFLIPELRAVSVTSGNPRSSASRINSLPPIDLSLADACGAKRRPHSA